MDVYPSVVATDVLGETVEWDISLDGMHFVVSLDEDGIMDASSATGEYWSFEETPETMRHFIARLVAHDLRPVLQDGRSAFLVGADRWEARELLDVLELHHNGHHELCDPDCDAAR